MTFLIFECFKIKNKVFAIILSIVLSVLAFFFLLGFFIFPWIKYNDSTRLAFMILWSISAIEYALDMIHCFLHSIRNDKKAMADFKKDRVAYTVTFIGGLVTFIVIFLLVFLKRNYNLSISAFGLITIAVLSFFVLLVLASLLMIYKNQYKKMLKHLSIALLCILCLLLIVISIMLYDAYPSLFRVFIGFGATILVSLAISIVCKLLFGTKIKNKVEIIPLVIFILICMGIGVGIALRYTISDDKLQEILTTIFASILGGTITLMGVAWTIKRQDEKNQLDKMEEARPFLGIISDMDLRGDEADKNFLQFCRKNYEGDLYTRLICRLINSDKAIFYIEKIVVDEKEYFPDTTSFIGKNFIFSIYLMESNDWQPKSKNIKLVITDINYQQRILEITVDKFEHYEKISEVA